MDSLLKFTNDDEKILNDYEIISKDSKNYEKGVKDYPEIANQEVYKLKDISKEDHECFAQPLAKPFLALYSFEGPEELSKEADIVVTAVKKQLRAMIEKGYIQRRDNDNSWHVFATSSI